MRQIKLIFLCLSLLFTFVNCKAPSIDEILVTDQYLLVTQQGCFTRFEANVKPGTCPQIFQKPPKSTNSECSFSTSELVLIRDPDGIHAPKIGLLYQSDHNLMFKIMDIDGSQIWATDKKRNGYHISQKDVSSGTFVLRTQSQTSFSAFFDTNSQSLIVLQQRGSVRVEQFLFSDIFTTGAKWTSVFKSPPSLTLFNRNEANSFGSRQNVFTKSHWSNDPYTDTLYYKAKNGNITTTYSLPVSQWLLIFGEGKNGKAVSTTTENRQKLSVSGGAIIEKSIETDLVKGVRMVNTTLRATSNLHNLTNTGILCEYETSLQDSGEDPVLVIRGYDYCLLRYGPGITRDDCKEKEREFLVAKGLIREDNEDPLKWLIITIIILLMIVALLLVYIYWLRSTFTVEDERTHQNEYETEASLFVAKQRSFPSAYPDPALLDVSVDKWN